MKRHTQTVCVTGGWDVDDVLNVHNVRGGRSKCCDTGQSVDDVPNDTMATVTHVLSYIVMRCAVLCCRCPSLESVSLAQCGNLYDFHDDAWQVGVWLCVCGGGGWC